MTRVSADTTARLRKFGADQGNTALAGIGAGLAGIGSPWAVPVLALAIIGVAARLWFMRRLNPTRNLLGNQPVQRAVIGSAVGVALAELTTGTGAAMAAGLGVLALVGAVMYEPYLRKGAAVEVPVVANLPGVAPGPRARDVTLPLVVGDLSVAAVGLLIAATGSSPWWWLLVVPVPLLARLQVLLDSRRRADRRRPDRPATAQGGGRVRTGVRDLHLVAGRRLAPRDHVAALSAADRPALHDRHPAPDPGRGTGQAGRRPGDRGPGPSRTSTR